MHCWAALHTLFKYKTLVRSKVERHILRIKIIVGNDGLDILIKR